MSAKEVVFVWPSLGFGLEGYLMRRCRQLTVLAFILAAFSPTLLASTEEQSNQPVVSQLVEQLKAATPEDRANAALALGRLKGRRSSGAPVTPAGLAPASTTGPSTPQEDIAVSALIRSLDDPHTRVRASAARALGNIGDFHATGPLLRTMEDPSRPETEKRIFILALGAIGDKNARTTLRQIAGNAGAPERTRAAAILSLADLGDPSDSTLIGVALSSNDLVVRFNATVALGRLGNRDSVPGLIAIARDESQPEALRVAAIASLGAVGGDDAVSFLVRQMNSQDIYLAMKAAQALGRARYKPAISDLRRIADRADDPYVRSEVQRVIADLSQ